MIASDVHFKIRQLRNENPNKLIVLETRNRNIPINITYIVDFIIQNKILLKTRTGKMPQKTFNYIWIDYDYEGNVVFLDYFKNYIKGKL